MLWCNLNNLCELNLFFLKHYPLEKVPMIVWTFNNFLENTSVWNELHNQRPWLAQLWFSLSSSQHTLGHINRFDIICSVLLRHSISCLNLSNIEWRHCQSPSCPLLPASEQKWGTCTRTWAIVPSLMPSTTCWLEKNIWSFTRGYEGYRRKKSPW